MLDAVPARRERARSSRRRSGVQGTGYKLFPPPPIVTPPSRRSRASRAIWEILGGQVSTGLLGRRHSTASARNRAASAPAAKPGRQHRDAVARPLATWRAKATSVRSQWCLTSNYFPQVQTPQVAGDVLPQDQIIPFLGGGPLLRCRCFRGTAAWWWRSAARRSSSSSPRTCRSSSCK